MNIKTFELERVQSIYENTVDYNLTESGFHPFTLDQLLNPDQCRELMEIELGYGQTNGSVPLRKTIAALYPTQTEDNILVTNGSAEANFIACHTLLEKGDEMVMMVPNYMQMWGIAEEMGAVPKAFHLREENGWAPDLEELKKLVNGKTKMIVVCNPNNPTGYTLTSAEMTKIIAIAESVGAWIYADEIYRGAELDGIEIPGFLGLYDKVLINGGLSKSYALPGLRLGWLAGPAHIIADSWAYHDYTTITTNILSEKIAEMVLSTDLRQKILNRNRKMLKENLAATLEWLAGFTGIFRFHPPKAGGMAFMHYDLDIDSTELAEWLRKEKSVFILAGNCYGMNHYFRIGIGAQKQYLLQGLQRVGEALNERFKPEPIRKG
ncbi:MAG: aminotransferase class I/II-fold pyridoxal phosphate-dependent enzyme [bacterium]|nr:aminotransferase class I/II-fold pyridoxal phosphate-dependent enzyme [bacterium]